MRRSLRLPKRFQEPWAWFYCMPPELFIYGFAVIIVAFCIGVLLTLWATKGLVP
jgi:hypothetical protein